MATQLFNIEKKYESKPFKNCIWESNLSWEDATAEINRLENSWNRNTGLVLEISESQIVVEESDGSETITFSIEEI